MKTGGLRGAWKGLAKRQCQLVKGAEGLGGNYRLLYEKGMRLVDEQRARHVRNDNFSCKSTKIGR